MSNALRLSSFLTYPDMFMIARRIHAWHASMHERSSSMLPGTSFNRENVWASRANVTKYKHTIMWRQFQISQVTGAKVQSRISDYTTELTFLVIDKASQSIPSEDIEFGNLDLPRDIPLADPTFDWSSDVHGFIEAQLLGPLSQRKGQLSRQEHAITEYRIRLKRHVNTTLHLRWFSLLCLCRMCTY